MRIKEKERKRDRSFTIETRSLVEDVPRVGGRLRRIRRRWITRQSSRDLSDRNARPQKRLHPGVAPGETAYRAVRCCTPLCISPLLTLSSPIASIPPRSSSSAFYNGPGKRIYRDLSFTRVSPFFLPLLLRSAVSLSFSFSLSVLQHRTFKIEDAHRAITSRMNYYIVYT